MSEDAIAEDGLADVDAMWREWQAERDRRATQLRRDARAVFSAMEGWQRVESAEEWARTCEGAREAYDSGRFLVERLGAERFLEPELMAVLWGLRRGLVGEGGGTASEAMLADLAVLAWYNAQRIQQWIGDLALMVEHEFFAQEAPSARFEGRYGRGAGLVVEERLARLGEQLLPLQERASRMVVRHLKALAELRRGPAPQVAIGQARQVNLGHGAQLNVEQRKDRGDVAEGSALTGAGGQRSRT